MSKNAASLKLTIMFCPFTAMLVSLFVEPDSSMLGSLTRMLSPGDACITKLDRGLGDFDAGRFLVRPFNESAARLPPADRWSHTSGGGPQALAAARFAGCSAGATCLSIENRRRSVPPFLIDDRRRPPPRCRRAVKAPTLRVKSIDKPSIRIDFKAFGSCDRFIVPPDAGT